MAHQSRQDYDRAVEALKGCGLGHVSEWPISGGFDGDRRPYMCAHLSGLFESHELAGAAARLACLVVDVRGYLTIASRDGGVASVTLSVSRLLDCDEIAAAAGVAS